MPGGIQWSQILLQLFLANLPESLILGDIQQRIESADPEKLELIIDHVMQDKEFCKMEEEMINRLIWHKNDKNLLQ